jgi:DNA-directed RNA polymerase subunit RPC12/RpoP
MARKLLAKFQFLSDFDKYLIYLEENNIPYYLSGMGIEQEGQTNYSEHLEVWVDEVNYSRAVELIKQDDYFSACPQCGSKNLKEAIAENLKSNLFGIFRISRIMRNPKFYHKCENCGHIFE